MTNADCIRRMSDDQLYDFLSEWECGDIDYSITFCDLCKQGGNELNLDCDGCRKHWLQRDAVDVGGLMYWKRNTTFTADTPQTTLCRECDDYAGDGMYCASNYLVRDFSTSAENCKANCIDKAKADIAERSSWSKTYEAMCEPQTDCGWGKPE